MHPPHQWQCLGHFVSTGCFFKVFAHAWQQKRPVSPRMEYCLQSNMTIETASVANPRPMGCFQKVYGWVGTVPKIERKGGECLLHFLPNRCLTKKHCNCIASSNNLIFTLPLSPTLFSVCLTFPSQFPRTSFCVVCHTSPCHLTRVVNLVGPQN